MFGLLTLALEPCVYITNQEIKYFHISAHYYYYYYYYYYTM